MSIKIEEHQREENKKKRDRFLTVKSAIDEWDPYELLPEAHSDEYDSESREITMEIYPTISVYKLAELIAEVFSFSFGDVFTIDTCMAPAGKIRENLNYK